MVKNIFCKNKTLFFIILTILTIAGSVAFGNRAFSYEETMTHPSLTDNIARVYNINFERKLSDEEINWLKQGSVEEDLAPRWLNHFYDPNTNQGLWGNFPSKQWARDSLAQALARGGNQTWQKAIDSYAKDNKEEAFYALGHILHLLEDSTVPAHTRLDAHPRGDPYERWVFNKVGSAIDFNAAPVAVGSLNAAFDDLAEYSSENFLSKDTININSIEDNFQISEEDVKLDNGTYKRYGFLNDPNGNKYKFVKIEKVAMNKIYSFDDSVHSDYFSLLAPKAVSYGAGVVKLFFDEGEKKKQEEQNKTWWQRLQEGASNWLTSISGSLYAGIGAGDAGNVAPSPAPPAGGAQGEAQKNTLLIATPLSATLPANTVIAQQKIAAQLPSNTVMAQEKTDDIDSNIIEEALPQDAEIPSAIVEETNPSQAKLPTVSSPSPTPVPSSTPSPAGSGPTTSQSSATDTTPPETTIDINPDSAVATTTATFEFSSSENNSTFSCQLDGAATSTCASPKEYTNLAEGSHIFKVSATDAAGSQDLTPAEHSWTINLASPSLSNITSMPARNSAVILWESNEAGIFQVEYGTSTSYGFLSATTSASTLNLSSLSLATTYHFRILAQDSLANATSTADNIFTTTSQAENVVISEIQIGGINATDEFIELYNPTAGDISLLSWRLTKKSASGATTNNLLTNFPDEIIPSHGYFLITHPSDYDGGVPADVVYSTTASLAENNTLILYSDAGHTIVDLVGLGTASSSETSAIVNPLDNQSVERKAFSNSTSTTMFSGVDKWQGNGYDSDNNSQDLVLQNNPNPQNSLMLTEPRNSVPGLMAVSSWPTWQGNLARSGQTSAVSLATSTMAVKWTATTTAAQSFSSRPVLDAEGNIYIGRADGLAKYSSSGSLIWLYANSFDSAPSPLVLDDGTIFFRNSNVLYAIDQNGRLKWKFWLDGTVSVNAALALMPDGAIITQGGQKVFAVNQDATLKWSFDSGREVLSSSGASAPIVDGDGKIYMAMDKYVYALSPTGQLLWEKGDDLGWFSSMSLSSNVLYLTAGINPPLGGVYALNTADGSIIWSNANGFNNKPYLAPVVDSADNIYVVLYYVVLPYGGSNHLNAYSATASTTSFLTHDNSVGASLATPILTSDGKIYLADQNLLKVFDAASGNLDGSFDTGDNLFYSYFGAVGNDGTIYAASNSALYAIGTGG